jgi:hypothetical protein
MARLRFNVGDKVDASRAENGEDHERGVVIDSYELIIGEQRKPMVVVEFEDGERKYMTAATPNVLPVYEEDEEESSPEPEPKPGPEPEAGAGAAEAEPDEAGDEGEDEALYIDDEEGASP